MITVCDNALKQKNKIIKSKGVFSYCKDNDIYVIFVLVKNSIEYYISQLLYKNDCVIVMNFGGFVCRSISANINQITGVLTPPNKSILFNSQLKENDGLLINHIAQA